jgi:hypothetical protein
MSQRHAVSASISKTGVRSACAGVVRFALALLVWGCCGAVRADPGYYVVTVYDNSGQRSIDLRYWTVKQPGSPEVIWPEIGFGYGVNTRWTTELYASFIGSSQMATRLNTWNWQNDVLLTQGEWPVDVALHSNLIREADGDGGYTVEFGPVLQTDIGRTQLNGNLFFERSHGGAYPAPTQLKYQWQLRHRWRAPLHFGLQGFGELGPWDHWAPHDQQSHRAGPALFGTLPLGDGRSFLCQASYLFGSIYGQHGAMFSLRAQYTF